MKLLIVGSEGFIGKGLIRFLNNRSYEVYSSDIVLKDEPNYFLINPERPDFAQIFRSQQFDCCINATGAANVQLSYAHPFLDYTLNTSNVYHILDGIRQYNPSCKFLNLSSAAVYGNPETLPIKETAKLNPLSPYGWHKLYSEQICKEFYSLFNIQTISVRIFSAYGEGLKKQLFWDLYKKISTARDSIELYGTGNETRDFIYIQDLVNAIECVLNSAIFDGSSVNIASGKASTIKEAVMCFLEAINKKLNIEFIGSNKIGDPLYWQADISLLESFGFKATYTLKKGIDNYCKWVQEKESH